MLNIGADSPRVDERSIGEEGKRERSRRKRVKRARWHPLPGVVRGICRPFQHVCLRLDKAKADFASQAAAARDDGLAATETYVNASLASPYLEAGRDGSGYSPIQRTNGYCAPTARASLRSSVQKSQLRSSARAR